jgi:hypothetical protein
MVIDPSHGRCAPDQLGQIGQGYFLLPLLIGRRRFEKGDDNNAGYVVHCSRLRVARAQAAVGSLVLRARLAARKLSNASTL